MTRNGIAVAFDDEKIDAIFKGLDHCDMPGVAVGIAIGGAPVYRKCYGLANLELPTVLSPSMRMRIYSITKQFTSFAYMLLCEEGRATVDDPIGKYLSQLHPTSHSVTMRQLMGHVGGLCDAHMIKWQFSGIEQKVTSAQILSFYHDVDEVQFPPTTAYSYSNGGYLLLTSAIEEIAGCGLEDVLRKRVFEPVGMHDTLLRRYDDGFVANSATTHRMTAAGCFARSNDMGAWAGEGGAVSTIDDMLRWLAHFDRPAIGNAETWSLIKSQQRLANGTLTGYGCGLQQGRYRGIEVLYHGGGGQGANALMLKVPSVGLDVIVITNRDDVSSTSLTAEILDTCLSGLEPPVTAFPGPIANGVFRSPTTGRILQLYAEGEKQIAFSGGVVSQFQRASDRWIWQTDPFQKNKLGIMLLNDQENPSKIRIEDYGNTDELIRVAPEQQPCRWEIAGVYRSLTTGTDALIIDDAGIMRLKFTGRFGPNDYALEHLAGGIWRTKLHRTASWLGGILSFDSVGDFEYMNQSIRSLKFRRVS